MRKDLKGASSIGRCAQKLILLCWKVTMIPFSAMNRSTHPPEKRGVNKDMAFIINEAWYACQALLMILTISSPTSCVLALPPRSRVRIRFSAR